VTTVKLTGKPSASAAEAIARHAQTLYDTPGSTRVGVIVLKRRSITAPDPGEEADPVVNLAIAALEIASPEQEEALRAALVALKLHRTAEGTLDEDAGITLGASTLEAVAGQLDRVETARLRVGLQHWADQARRTLHTEDLNLIEARHELDNLATGLEALLLLGRLL
jgi:hypothetical protein